MNSFRSLVNLRTLLTTWDLDSANFASLVNNWIPDKGGDYELIVIGLQHAHSNSSHVAQPFDNSELSEIHSNLTLTCPSLSNDDVATLACALQGCKGVPIPHVLKNRRLDNDPPVNHSFHKTAHNTNFNVPDCCPIFQDVHDRLGDSYVTIVSTIINDVALSIFLKIPHAHRVKNISVISKSLSLFNILRDSVAIIASFQYENATLSFVTNGSMPINDSSLRCLQFLDVVNQVRFADQLVDFDIHSTYTFWLGSMQLPEMSSTVSGSVTCQDTLLYHRNLGHVFTGWEEAYLSLPPTNWPQYSTSRDAVSALARQDSAFSSTRLNSSSDRILWKTLPAFAGLVQIHEYFRLPAQINPILQAGAIGSPPPFQSPLILSLQLSVHSSTHPLASYIVPGDARQLETTSLNQLRQILLRAKEAADAKGPSSSSTSSDPLQLRYSLQMQGSPFFNTMSSTRESLRDLPKWDPLPSIHPEIGPLPVPVHPKKISSSSGPPSAGTPGSPSLSPAQSPSARSFSSFSTSSSPSEKEDPHPPNSAQPEVHHTPNPLSVSRSVLDAESPSVSAHSSRSVSLTLTASAGHSTASSNPVHALSGVANSTYNAFAPATWTPNPTRVTAQPMPATSATLAGTDSSSHWRVPPVQAAPRLLSKSILSQKEALAAIQEGHIVLPHLRFTNVRAHGILSVDTRFLSSPFLVFLSDRAIERGIKRRSFVTHDTSDSESDDSEGEDYDSPRKRDMRSGADKNGDNNEVGALPNPLHASSAQSDTSTTSHDSTLQDSSVVDTNHSMRIFLPEQLQIISANATDLVYNPLRSALGQSETGAAASSTQIASQVKSMDSAAVQRYVRNLVAKNRIKIDRRFHHFPRSEPACNTLNPIWEDATIDEIAILSTDPEDLSFGHIIIVLVDGLCPNSTRLGQVCLPISAPLMLDGIPHQFSIPISKGTRHEGTLHGNVELVWRLRPELKFRNILLKQSRSCCSLM